MALSISVFKNFVEMDKSKIGNVDLSSKIGCHLRFGKVNGVAALDFSSMRFHVHLGTREDFPVTQAHPRPLPENKGPNLTNNTAIPSEHAELKYETL